MPELPRFELGFAGTPLRRRLVAAVLGGSKTTTTGLRAEYHVTGEPLPRPGNRFGVPDEADEIVAVVETVDVRVVPMRDVDLRHVIDEGESDETVAQWRAGHTAFFESVEVRAALADPDFTVDDDTMLVLLRIRLVETVS